MGIFLRGSGSYKDFSNRFRVSIESLDVLNGDYSEHENLGIRLTLWGSELGYASASECSASE